MFIFTVFIVILFEPLQANFITTANEEHFLRLNHRRIIQDEASTEKIAIDSGQQDDSGGTLPDRELPDRERIWDEDNDYVDDPVEDSEELDEYYDQAIVALISVATAISICGCMMLCMYISHIQHADDIDTTGKPRRRCCCCIILKPKKPKAIYGTFDPSYPTDFIDVQVQSVQEGSQHVMFVDDPNHYGRDSSEENDGYIVDSTNKTDYTGAGERNGDKSSSIKPSAKPKKDQPKRSPNAKRSPYTKLASDSEPLGGSQLENTEDVSLEDLRNEERRYRRVSFREPVSEKQQNDI